jgi:anti-anti-sigma regulatory factor
MTVNNSNNIQILKLSEELSANSVRVDLVAYMRVEQKLITVLDFQNVSIITSQGIIELKSFIKSQLLMGRKVYIANVPSYLALALTTYFDDIPQEFFIGKMTDDTLKSLMSETLGEIDLELMISHKNKNKETKNHELITEFLQKYENSRRSKDVLFSYLLKNENKLEKNEIHEIFEKSVKKNDEDDLFTKLLDGGINPDE